jgi:predicted GNAT family acetyltransferase
VRLDLVYTPAELRRHGPAGALIGAMSTRMLEEGRRAILYAQLANPTSNARYRRIGYRAVAEILQYRFFAAAT